jgi:error-prone DNA polymerase
LKCRYLAAFTAALLNNQPMGFYSPATIVKDAQRHGLRVKPIDILRSDWLCTIEDAPNKEGQLVPCLRVGLRYARGLRQKAADALLLARTQQIFSGIDDLVRRVPELQKSELECLSEIGALNSLGKSVHRRSALWQVARATRTAGPLLDSIAGDSDSSPLQRMNNEERLVADFHGSGLTPGPHPMAYCRKSLASMNIRRAIDLERIPDGAYTTVAGCVIARQRPGTAKGFVFLSLEDETGIANVIIHPDLYQKYRLIINREKFLSVSGILQNQDRVISVKASHVAPVSISAAEIESHDYH